MKRWLWVPVAFAAVAATIPPQCNGGGGSNPPEPRELTQKVRPIQGGTQVDVAEWGDVDDRSN